MRHILDELVGRLSSRFGSDMLTSSAAVAGGPEVVARQLERLAELQLGLVVEIGTRHGVMAAVLAQFAEWVITIDVEASPLVRDVLACAGVTNVVPLVLDGDHAKGLLLDRLRFDVAFIDGDHHYEGVAFDFAHTRHCGRILFHDYGDPRYEGVTRFVDSLEDGVVELDPPFAWWQADGLDPSQQSEGG